MLLPEFIVSKFFANQKDFNKDEPNFTDDLLMEEEAGAGTGLGGINTLLSGNSGNKENPNYLMFNASSSSNNLNNINNNINNNNNK